MFYCEVLDMKQSAKKIEPLIRLDNPRVWRTYLGGKMIDALHGNPDGADGHFPEEWIMSVVAARNVGRESVPDEGLSHIFGSAAPLKELIEAHPEEYIGGGARNCDLGVLVKLIDSAERLTIQAHPDVKTAKALFASPHGKTECWHILGGREINGEKPCIYLGFKQGVTREHWKDLFVRQDTGGMLDAMERFDVRAGDTVLIEGGMPHAIGAGCFLAEIQEPTDFTIRVERTTPSGFAVDDFLCHQGLGFEKMFDVFHYKNMSRDEIAARYFIKPSDERIRAGGRSATLVGYGDTPMFRLDEIHADGETTIAGSASFCGLYVLDGRGRAAAAGRRAELEKTAQFFVPAGTGDITIFPDEGAPLRILRFMGPRRRPEAQ